ncbi:NLR family CARD domain-containing protein 3, partial [Galemys pyrenaicus]
IAPLPGGQAVGPRPGRRRGPQRPLTLSPTARRPAGSMRNEEARGGQGHGAGSAAEQVKALLDLLASKGGQGPQAPATPPRTPDAPQGPLGNGRQRRASPGHPLPACPSPADARMQRHREALLSRAGGSQGPGGPSARLSSLLLAEGLTDLQLQEHDFTQVEAARGRWGSTRTIALDRLFQPLTRVSIPPRISITIGVAGVGKTSLVRTFVGLWARGQVGQDFSLVLPLAFRDLNTHERLSADRLVRCAVPHAGESGLAAAAPAKVLLVLDGLDECKTPLDFSNTAACADPKKEMQLDQLVTNIIRGNLFPEASVWVTSRPSAASQIPGGLVDRLTEIRGFNEEELKGCLEQMFPEDPALAAWVLGQMQADRALYLMCTVPAFCRLAASVLGHWRRRGPGPQDAELWPPRTLCELYAWYFRMALGAEGQDRDRPSPRVEPAVHGGRKLVGTLGRLAFHGLLRRKYVFYEPDLKTYGVDLAQLQPLGGRLLQREDALGPSAAYCFAHLSLQEFVAAAYYCSASRRAIFDLFTEGGVSWPRLGFLTHFKTAAQRAMQAEDGRLDVFLRFLSGLLSPRVNALLAGPLLAPGEHWGYQVQAAELLQGCLRPDATVSARAVNVLRCLHELQHTELARSVEGALQSGDLAGLTTAPHRAALAYLLQVSDACSQEADLSLHLSQGVLQSLLPQLLYCRSLRLDANQFQDPVMELLGSVLSGKDCRIQRISLAENQISNKGAKALARSLLVNRSLTALDLRSNGIGAQGAKALADALKINRTLTSLRYRPPLRQRGGKNSIGPAGAQRVADTLKQNRSLKQLTLSSNSIGDGGAKALAEALRVNRGLESLEARGPSRPGQPRWVPLPLQPAKQLHQRLGGGGTDGGPLCQPDPPQPQVSLRPAAGTGACGPASVPGLLPAVPAPTSPRPSLAPLLLTWPVDSPVRPLLPGQQLGVLSPLSLRENSISSEGAQDLARALCTNSTLRNLDLTANLLHDQGAQALAVAVRENRALRTLHLQWNFIQASAAQALGQALQLNRSLTSLDLQENAIGDAGASAVAQALKANTALTALYLQVASIGAAGAQALGEALAVNSTLQVLEAHPPGSLRGNAIGVAGAKALASALKVNSSLRRLSLQENSLGMDGAICVATALSGNRGLQYINLQGNHIGASGARMISEAIKSNAPTCAVEL